MSKPVHTSLLFGHYIFCRKMKWLSFRMEKHVQHKYSIIFSALGGVSSIVVIFGCPNTLWLYHLRQYTAQFRASCPSTKHCMVILCLLYGLPNLRGVGREALQALRFLFQSPCDSRILCHNQIVWTIDWEQVHQPRDGRNHNQATFDLTRRACQWEGW